MSETITVKELDDLTLAIKEQEKKIEAKGLELKELNKELQRLEGKAVQYLKDLERDRYDSPHGKLVIKEKWRVNLPENDIEKAKLFDHLRERGIFDKYATVNSNSLNALYMADWTEAKKEGRGMEFVMPGIGAPKLHEALDFKATKD